MTTRNVQRASILLLASVTLAACPDNGPHGHNDVASRISVFPTPPVPTPPRMTISGTVASATGTLISGAIIKVNSSYLATTDGAGTFECSVTSAGNTYVTVTADKPGYVSGIRLLATSAASAV